MLCWRGASPVSPTRWHVLASIHPSVRFIDPDVVEEHNIGRQLFSYGDLGANKAQVLAKRFNAALGLNIAAIDQPVDAERHFEGYGSRLLIGCVDNHLARRELAKVNGLWLDCGNHTNAGQIVLGNTGNRDQMLRNLDGGDGRYRYLPNAALLFPALLEPEPEPTADVELSCAELALRGDQALFINDLMAAVASQYVYKLLHRQPVATFVSFIDGDSLSVRSLPICRNELEAYLN